MNRVAEFTNILSVFQWIRIVLRHGVDLFFYIATAFLLQPSVIIDDSMSLMGDKDNYI
jgi:hypothetical protein